ncbi:hypothetical protein AVEN_210765-1 [Araneus ventricosus]|uniref:Uncharacterized protein n=1 Tax=Araneus ventricosus TaxID=182803 RepID=A0A4Y2W0U4_ARAVE|nr:hypothetical protein AVEN_210765-1 [Araneus ventricosus]
MMRRQLFLSTSRANSKVGSMRLMRLDVTETNTNTGWKGGILRKLEELTDKPIQWTVCLFVSYNWYSELSSRTLTALHQAHSYTGLIVSKLPDCEKLPIVSFKPIKCGLRYHSAGDLRKLSNDLRYLRYLRYLSCSRYLRPLNSEKAN